jgi:hypothetical protein
MSIVAPPENIFCICHENQYIASCVYSSYYVLIYNLLSILLVHNPNLRAGHNPQPVSMRSRRESNFRETPTALFSSIITRRETSWRHGWIVIVWPTCDLVGRPCSGLFPSRLRQWDDHVESVRTTRHVIVVRHFSMLSRTSTDPTTTFTVFRAWSEDFR